MRPGSVRVDSNLPENIPNVAYKTPEGNIVVIVQNTAEEEQEISVEVGSKKTSFRLPAGAVGTFVM